MRILSRCVWLRRGLVFSLCTFAVFCPSSLVWGQERQKQVLVVYSSRRDTQIAILGDRDMPRLLAEGLQQGLDYYSEHLDQPRFGDPKHQQALRDFLRQKYTGRRFDAVIAMSEAALDFVAESRTALFPDTPVIFFASNPAARRIANSTGVKAALNLSGTVELALELQPDTKNVFVVSGADTADAFYSTTAQAQFRPYEYRLTFTYLSALPAHELEKRLATLPERSIVYYLIVSRDGAGEHFHPLRYLDRVTAVANAPTYSWVDSATGHGVVGGSMKSQETEIAALAGVALRVLNGEPAESIPVAELDLNVRQVDWRQLRRWGISEARVPTGTRVLFRDQSLWDRYKLYVVGVAMLVLAQAALIIALLVQRERRRRAEEQMRASQAQLRASYERIRDLGKRLLNAQEAERSVIARELHDDIGQQLAVLAIDLDVLNSAGSRRRDVAPLARDALERTQKIATTLQNLSHELHPAKAQLIGLVAALESLRRDFSRTGLSVRLSHSNVPGSLPQDLTLCLFRIVQEALRNVVKHSGASEVAVQLSGSGQALEVTIVDDGMGFDVDSAWTRGLGLISMSERLEPFRGTLYIRSKPGAGTQLEIRVPLPRPSATKTVA